jgi:predicted phage baseplate assembly protein
VSNPLAARGGIDPESLERVRQDAPEAFRTQRRAVTPADYADTAQKCDTSVQRAAARFRWTGSWRTVFVTVDRSGGLRIDAEFRRKLEACLEAYRMAGHDVQLEEPRFAPLEMVMTVCVKRDYFLSNVEGALREVFSNRTFPDGRLGMFHPDRFSFGQPVYLSTLYAAAQEVEGVDSVEITTFQRQGVISTAAIANGFLAVGPLEIARLDNDPNFPENGVFTLDLRGGR